MHALVSSHARYLYSFVSRHVFQLANLIEKELGWLCVCVLEPLRNPLFSLPSKLLC